LCAKIQWIHEPGQPIGPQIQHRNRLALSFFSIQAGTRLIQPADPPDEVIVSMWMPGMGHGSEKTIVSKQVPSNGGKPYLLIENVVFIMAGEWELWVTLLDHGSFSEKDKISLKL
jgi:hypothetical protein